MTISWMESVEGQKFEVTSSTWALHEGGITVPLSVAESLDNETIGRYVKTLIETARYAEALEMADVILCYARESSDLRNRLPLELLESSSDQIRQMRMFSGRDPSIDKAIVAVDNRIREEEDRLRATQARMLHEEKIKSHSQKVRSEMQSEYSRTFLKLGRRDGFRCAICESSDPDLQIDHIIPVSRGGTNDPDNLQLLCRRCNLQKLDRIDP